MQHVTDENFEAAVLASGRPVLVDFWAEWCGPCKAQKTVLEAVAPEYDGRADFAMVDVDASVEAATRFHIRALPTLVLFVGGKPVGQLAGLNSRSRVAEFLDRHLAQA